MQAVTADVYCPEGGWRLESPAAMIASYVATNRKEDD
jgi:hypothetical protein